ncbi:MAG: AI-2E family transporter [Vicinamibacterales bacterium]
MTGTAAAPSPQLAQKPSAWLTFAGCVLVIAVLYWARAVLMPVALALLITFVLTPPVTYLQRHLGRVPAVLLVVVLVFTVLAGIGWAIATQLSGLAAELPRYRDNIRQKVVDIRNAGRGGSVERVEETLKDIQREIERTEPQTPDEGQPVVVQPTPATSPWSFPEWFGPAIEPLSTAGLVIALVIFMLLEREDLRGRLLGLFGHGRLAVTTKALDEAGHRVSRQLLLQTLVNAIYGVAAGVGLWWIGVPYPMLWMGLGAVLRFIPYLGPLAAALGPIVISLAVHPGWVQPLWTVALFVGLELFTNLVLETVLYAGAAGVSQVALLIAVAGWTWLWGGVGLLLATPLTVCLVVLGKHVPGLEFLSTLIADSPALAPDVAYYQRLLARDEGEAADIIDRHLATHDVDTVYDALLVPALAYAERDRAEGRLSPDDERTVLDQTRDLMGDTAAIARTMIQSRADASSAPGLGLPHPVDRRRIAVLAYPVGGPGDELALRMLEQLVSEEDITLEVPPARLLSAELVALASERTARIICLADLPPSPPSRTRYLVRKLRTALPNAVILVGRWGPASLSDDGARPLLEAGANHVASALLETRDRLREIARQRLDAAETVTQVESRE